MQAVNFMAGVKSMNQDAWNKAMETIGIPKQKWDGMQERFIKVLLDEHETILSSYRAQKYGGGEGWRMSMRRMEEEKNEGLGRWRRI